MMPYLAFLATNYTVRIAMCLIRSFRHAIKALPASSISVAVLVIMLSTTCTWKFVHTRSDRSISINSFFHVNLLRYLDPADASGFIEVLFAIVIRSGGILAAIENTELPPLRKLLGPLCIIGQLLRSPWQSVSFLMVWITMRVSGQISSTNKVYRHTKIKTNREIRLVILHRRLPYFPIKVTLQHFHLEFVPPYEAISYTLGSAEKDSKILICGLPFYTATSAFNVLRSRSSIWRTRVI
jgi:hypothetical protein